MPRRSTAKSSTEWSTSATNNTAPDDLDAKQNATDLGYCVKCQATREMTDTKSIERGGGPALEGKCVVCEAAIFVIGAT